MRVKLENQIRFETLISDLSAQFVRLPCEDADAGIEHALEGILRFFQCERCGLVQVGEAPKTLLLTYDCYAEGIEHVPKHVNLAPLVPWGFEHVVEKGNPFIISRLQDLPPEAEKDRQTLLSLGVRSTLDIPIFVGEKVRYLISIQCTSKERDWPTEYIPRLRLLGEVLVNALERKKADDALRESEARLSLATDSADAGIWELGLEYQSLWGNQRAFSLYGLPPAERIDFETFINVVHPEDRDLILQTIQTAVDTGSDAQREYRVVLPDGSIRWVFARGRVQQCQHQQEPVLTGVSIDITAQKASELALKAAYEEIHHLKERLQDENLYLRQEAETRHDHTDIVGRSQALQEALHRVEQVAPTNATVLLEGETGTGKELFARAIHEASQRNSRPMVCVNCGAIPGALIESELFGRERGAYTGALARQIGRFELANGSTVFLDEVAELPLELQVKLLRVLQEHTIERLGSPRLITVDVRVIAATNQDLARAVEEGRFRKDLYYRLSVFPIRVPPLRERKDDIPLLAWALVEEFNKAMGKSVDSISRESMGILIKRPWHGNVRELRNIIERAMILATGPQLQLDLPAGIGADVGVTSLHMKDVECAHIRSVLQLTNGRIRGRDGAAELLGLRPSTLASRMQKLGICRKDP